jgi:hypothetical protein
MADTAKNYTLSEDGTAMVVTEAIIRTIPLAQLQEQRSRLAWQLEQTQREIDEIDAQILRGIDLIAAGKLGGALPSPNVPVGP